MWLRGNFTLTAWVPKSHPTAYWHLKLVSIIRISVDTIQTNHPKPCTWQFCVWSFGGCWVHVILYLQGCWWPPTIWFWEGHELNHLQGGPESENPEIYKWGEITRLIRGDFTGIYNWRSGAHPCHRHPRSAPDVRQVQKMMRDPQGSRLLVQHLFARPKVRNWNFFGRKNTVKQMDGWLDSQRFTGFLPKKWRVVLCATYLATFCVLHLPDRIRLHSVWSSGSVGGIYLNIFESGFSLRQSWQVWKLIGTSPVSQQRMKGCHWQSGRGSMSTKIYLHMCFFIVWKLYTHTGNSESTQNMK